MLHSPICKGFVLTVLVGFGAAETALAEEIRFATPIPATMRTKNNTKIQGTLEGLSPRLVLFRSSRGRQLKMPNYQVRFVITKDGSFRYRPGLDRYNSVLKKAKALNAKLKQRAADDEAAANAKKAAGTTGGNSTGGNNTEPPPSSGSNDSGGYGNIPPPGMGPGSGMPPGSGLPPSSGRFGGRFGGTGRTGNTGRTGGTTFPRTGQRSGFSGGMPPGGGNYPGGGMPDGGLPPEDSIPGGNPPPSNFPGSSYPGMPDGADYGASGSGYPGTTYPRTRVPRMRIPSAPDTNFPGGPDASDFPSNDYDSGLPSMGTYTQKQCSNCGKVVPNHLTAGDHCPHCGILCTYDESNGKRVSGLAVGGGVFGGLALISLIIFVVRRSIG